MRKKNPKEAKGKKQSQPPNLFVPQNLLSSIQEEKLITCPEDKMQSNIEYIPLAEPFEIPKEWEEKSEEELYEELIPIEYRKMDNTLPKIEQPPINNNKSRLLKKNKTIKKDKKKQTEKIIEKPVEKINEEEIKNDENLQNNEEIKLEHYNDPMHEELINNLPISFLKTNNNNILWLRPEEYIINENIDKEIKKLYPKKKYVQMREEIKQVYNEEKEDKLKSKNSNFYHDEDENMDDFMNDDSITLKKTIFKDFYKFLDNKYKFFIVNFTERDETDEEYKKRLEELIEKKETKNNKNSSKVNFKNTKNNKIEDIPKIKINIFQPNNINISSIIEKDKNNNKNFAFISWISSIYQFINDLQIKDCITQNEIFSNIYPQKNGIPIYNPHGHYVIKMHFMGKFRRIDIDDKIPCNKDGEYIFPRCDKLNELWPAILTKALMKLNLYKVKHPFYFQNEEIIDISYIYELTGYHTEIINDIQNVEKIQNLLSNNLSDENFLNKKKFLLCLNYLNIDNENEIYYEDYLEQFKLKNMIERSSDISNISNNNINNNNEKKLLLLHQRKKSLDHFQLINTISTINTNKQKENKEIKFSSSDNLPEIKTTNQQKSNNNIKYKKPQFNFFLGNEKISDQYWKNKDILKSRDYKRQSTVMLKGKKMIEQEIAILANYAYSINDFFINGKFNMNRIKPLDFEDLKKSLLGNKVVFKQLSKHEKIEYIRQRKILKEKQLIIKNNRIIELQQDGKPFFIIKIKNNSCGNYPFASFWQFNESEINMAKKCILNNWKYPPPKFFEHFFKQFDPPPMEDGNFREENQNVDKSKFTNIKKRQKLLNKNKHGSLDWTRNNYIQLIGEENLKKYEETENNIIKEPLSKIPGGNWIKYDNFKTLFNTILILNETNSLYNDGNKILIDNNWNNFKIDCFEPLDDFMVLKLNNENIINKNKNYEGFLVFEPNNEKSLLSKDKINNYIIMDIVDENKNIIYPNITMCKFYCTHKIENLRGDLNYYVIIRGGVYLFGYFLQMFSEAHKIEHMSYQNYLKEISNYQYLNFKFEHPYIYNQSFYLLARFHILNNNNNENNNKEDEKNNKNFVIENNNNDLKILINVKYPIKYLKYFIKIFISKEGDLNFNDKEVFINEEIPLKKGNYIITVHFQNITSTIKENNFEIDIVYSNKNYRIEQIDNIDFYQIEDEYTPNRHNIIFKEIIYSCDTIYTSMNIAIEQKNNSNIENENLKTLNNKLKLIFLIYQLENENNTNIPFIPQIFSHNLRGNLLKKYISFNSLIIPYFCFEGGLIIEKKQGRNIEHTSPHFPYLFICYIDDSVDLKNSIAINKLNWSIKIFPSEHLCFIRDFSKEEHEKNIKLNWEENEPGRSEKAKIARKRFNLQQLLKSGKVLSIDDINIINFQRTRKKSSIDEEHEVHPKSKKNTNKPEKNTNKKNDEKEKDKEKEKELKKEFIKANINLHKTLPSPENHCSGYIKNYLSYTYKSRTKRINSRISSQYLKIINNNKIQFEKNKLINDKVDLYNKMLTSQMNKPFFDYISNNNNCLSNKNIFKSNSNLNTLDVNQMFNTFYKNNIKSHTIEADKISFLVKSRNNLKLQFKAKKNAENSVNEILKNSNNYDFQYMWQCYLDTSDILGKEVDIERGLFKIISNKKMEEIKNVIKKYSAKDKNNVIKLVEEIENNKYDVDKELVDKLKDLISK